MAETQPPTSCLICQTELPPGTELSYFAQSLLFPKKNDLGFGEEVHVLLGYLEALCATIGWGEGEERHKTELAQLAADITKETQRRFRLYVEGVSALELRARQATSTLTES